jgi:hypothetical protein
MAGVFVVRATHAPGAVIDDLVLLVECSLEGEWDGRVLYLPLRGV